MSEQTTETTAADPVGRPDPTTEPAPAADAAQLDESLADDRDDTSKAGREAARYRVRLRETEAERDQLRSLVETLQRAEAERAVSDVLRVPAGLWTAGTALADLLDDQGRVDPEKAIAAARTARETVGLAAARRTPLPDSSQGRGAGGDSRDAWTKAFRHN